MPSIDNWIKKGMDRLQRKWDKAYRCPLCGCYNFFLSGMIDDWLFEMPRYFYMNNEERRIVTVELLKRFKEKGPTDSFQDHHYSYVMGVTMFVCHACHKKIHHSDEKPWCDWKPIDKRTEIKLYEKN